MTRKANPIPRVHQLSPTAWVRDVVERNRSGQAVGLFSVCSAHRTVLGSTMRHARENDRVVCIESTSNQVNQFGGYTGLTPDQFALQVRNMAKQAGLSPERVLLGGDHLGPYPWRSEALKSALKKAACLVRSCVLAGYGKIHLDASMRCADDPPGALPAEVIADRAAELCLTAEQAWRESGLKSLEPLYVIGTDVPIPGGEESTSNGPVPTRLEDAEHSLAAFEQAFVSRGLKCAWERVIGLVVQTGAEFADSQIYDYNPENTKDLRDHLPSHPDLVYEAHSTDYQLPHALRNMVADHFAILKVGPWLTFAYRQAIFALVAIEREWLGKHRDIRLSSVRETLEDVMLRDPKHWLAYCHDSDPERQKFFRQYSYADRCRYYWTDPQVEREINTLFANLSSHQIPNQLIDQYFPDQYESIRTGLFSSTPEMLVKHRIYRVLDIYRRACEGEQSKAWSATARTGTPPRRDGK